MANQNGKKKAGRKAKPAQKQQRKVVVASPMADKRVRDYLTLLADPCSANLAHPPYSGTDAGYLVRTTDILSVSATNGSSLTPGTIYRMDGVVSVTPSGYVSYGQLSGATATVGGSITLSSGGFAGNFLSTTAVRRFRPVAACLKWIPNGPYSSRQGLVGTMYGVGTLANAGEAVNATTVLASCTRTAPNGGECHEVRWLPAAIDENFTTATAAVNGAGTMTVVLSQVDGTASNATNINANGYLEITTVWEWTPSGTAGITVNPQSPIPHTTQSVLANIGDMGAFLYSGVLRAGEGMIRGATAGAMVGLTAGYRNYATRGRSMPLLT